MPALQARSPDFRPQSHHQNETPKSQLFVAYKECALTVKTNRVSREMMEKGNLSKCNLKASRSSCTHITKETAKTKIIQKKQRSSLHINKEQLHQEDITVVNIYVLNVNIPNL
jgi:hypothetical protein